MKRHPLSAAFPDLPADDFELLVEDIKKNGLRDQGWVYEGQIIDGWHRYLACEKAGAKFRYDEYKGSDPIAFVLSRNAYRRHLTASQRAAAVVACHEWKKVGANQHKKGGSAPGAEAPSAADLAREAQVSERTIVQAKAAHAAGLGEAVRDGAMSVKEAAAVATGRIDKPKAEKKPAEPPPKSNGKDLSARVQELETENATLRERLEQAFEGAEEAVARAETAQEMLETEPAKIILKLKTEIVRLEKVRDHLLNQNGQLVRDLKKAQRQLDRMGKNERPPVAAVSSRRS